ncbi:hypothetical protein AKAW_11434 [Aspergillus luchuensis IFO 4308]|nr:hypothetical protein AKAW_11434 [Aspergillus luchuensis IFO 4308]
MAKRHYRAWTPGEEQDYPSWVARHLHLTWLERARKYSIERKPRTKESLRTKYRLLEKDIRRHRRPMWKTPSRLGRQNPRRLGRGQHRTWPSPISISTPTPSEHRSDDPSPLAMRVMRPPTPTRVARPQNHGQTARSTQGPKLTVQSPAKYAHRRGFETHWVGFVRVRGITPGRACPKRRSKQSDVLTTFSVAGYEKEHRVPSRSLVAPSKIDLLWQLLYHICGRTRQ